MKPLEVPLTEPIEGPKGNIDKVVFTKQPTAKQLISYGAFIKPDSLIDWPILSKYLLDLTSLGVSEIERLSQRDFGTIGQKLFNWTYLEKKK